MVEDEQTEHCQRKESSLDPKYVTPACWVCIGSCTSSKTSNSGMLISFGQTSEVDITYNPPTAPPRNANPLAKARYFNGKTSDGIACTIEIVESVHPTRIPPPISIFIEVALAETTAPIKERTGGPIAKYFLSRTSESRPTIGDSTLCINSGPYPCYGV